MPSRTTLPRWSDKDAVARLVAEEIEQAELDELYRLEAFKAPDFTVAEHRAMSSSVVSVFGITEQEAVAAALRGNLEPLATLLRPFGGMFGTPNEVNPAIRTLSTNTWGLVAQFLTGERNLHTGRRKGEPGRPKMTSEERRAMNPVHDAADEFYAIKNILKQLYPEQPNDQIEYRAERIAQDRANITTSIRNLLRRPRRGRHRV